MYALNFMKIKIYSDKFPKMSKNYFKLKKNVRGGR